MEEHIHFWKCHPNTLNFFCQLFMCRVTPSDEGIAETRGPHKAKVERKTHMLVLPLSKGVTQSKDNPKKILSNLMDKMD